CTLEDVLLARRRAGGGGAGRAPSSVGSDAASVSAAKAVSAALEAAFAPEDARPASAGSGGIAPARRPSFSTTSSLHSVATPRTPAMAVAAVAAAVAPANVTGSPMSTSSSSRAAAAIYSSSPSPTQPHHHLFQPYHHQQQHHQQQQQPYTHHHHQHHHHHHAHRPQRAYTPSVATSASLDAAPGAFAFLRPESRHGAARAATAAAPWRVDGDADSYMDGGLSSDDDDCEQPGGNGGRGSSVSSWMFASWGRAAAAGVPAGTARRGAGGSPPLAQPTHAAGGVPARLQLPAGGMLAPASPRPGSAATVETKEADEAEWAAAGTRLVEVARRLASNGAGGAPPSPAVLSLASPAASEAASAVLIAPLAPPSSPRYRCRDSWSSVDVKVDGASADTEC
ncbi:hypothetical protein HK405_015984, partial [Cladochytrium tenue]